MTTYGDEIEINSTPVFCAPILRFFNKKSKKISDKKEKNINAAGYILFKSFQQFRNSELKLKGETAKKLKNKTNNKYTFGKYNDEVYYGTVDNHKYIFFAGSDFRYDFETSKEWYSNTLIIMNSRQIDNSFVNEVERSLPETFKNEVLITIGFSRGGFTMSNFCKNSSLKFKAIIFLAAPGSLYDMKNICKDVYEFYHELDKVVSLQNVNTKLKINSHKTHIWVSLKDMDTQKVLSNVHGRGSNGYIQWLRDFSSYSKDLDVFTES
tara:strand:+ start:995 stop:1792 length:798 start_codon:yes stop_codon:yes gene_type:complete